MKPKKKIKSSGFLYHFVAEIKDGNEPLYVYKFFGHYNRWWHYVVWDKNQLETYSDIHKLRTVRKKHE